MDVQYPAAPGESPADAISVATVTETVKAVLEGAFTPLWIRGEISDFTAHRNGHWYFALRDRQSQIKCVVWNRDQGRFAAPPDDGMQVVALGQVTVYTARGDLQLTVKALGAEGDGLRRKALELARARLEKDGLLDPSRKRRLPRFPRRIAVITSPSGAALHDILSVVRRRSAGVEVVVIPARVQGAGAPAEIIAALRRLARWNDADIAIVGRGGGGHEDLWAFNEERVARAVAACPVPTISAVGHEIDTTLCDLVADVRAATPSAAAETAVPDRRQVVAAVRAGARALREGMASVAATRRHQVDSLAGCLRDATSNAVGSRKHRVGTAGARLESLSPLATLSRGYAVAHDVNGHTLSSVRDFVPDELFELTLRDGRIRANTISAEPS